ncbi:MAG: hypothetical protein WC907_05490, partial [Acholeplasmataceae bacterium]
KDMHEVCPNALFLNYTNPMAILTGYMEKHLDIKVIGLCHSVQVCVPHLFESLKMEEYKNKVKWEIAGINHQAWLLKVEDLEGNDLYPEIKKRSLSKKYLDTMSWDLVRHDLMHRFNYYVTESSEHTAEYLPYYIKRNYPELIKELNIPLDEYPRRCINQINEWEEMKKHLISHDIEHEKSDEFAASIINSITNDIPYTIHGNVLNKGFITNLPDDSCVEVKCLVDRNGIQPTYVGEIPEQLAALNRTNINVQNLTILAAKEKRKDLVYMAAYLDPHTSSELSLDEIKNLCDDLFVAHKDWLPEYK